MSSLPLNSNFPLRSAPSKIESTPAKEAVQAEAPLDAFKDARQLVRLAQCPQCSYPLQEPVTLPCGNSICKKCIPKLHVRPNISYPATANRLQGFTCPFSNCKKEHADGDCSVNVVLNKIVSVVKSEIDGFRNSPEASEVVLQLEERDKWSIAGVSSLRETEPHIRCLNGGRLASTYTLAEMGELQRDSEVSYTAISAGEKSEVLDTALLEQLRETTRAELDCQVCYSLFLDPFTTPCGHTFCRKCLHRVLDHANICPVCRRGLRLPSGITAEQGPSTILLGKLLVGLCPAAVAARAEAAKDEDLGGLEELNTSLFVCTLSFPHMPTFLHIFEPRYRLMIRRAVENGDRKFGMLLHNPSMTQQGELGNIPFYQYGTLLHIMNMHMMLDGRSLIETVGVSRFRVLQHGSLDGYTVGEIERVEDMTIAEEEALEAEETASSSPSFSAQEHFGAPPQHTATRDPGRPMTPAELTAMPTRDIMQFCASFVTRMQALSAPWLHRRVLQAYGECPEDPAIFPWWLASVLPTADVEKYKLLATSSVRERLKICAAWIVQLEAQRSSNQGSSCTVL